MAYDPLGRLPQQRQRAIFIRKVAISKHLTDLSRNRFVDSLNIDRR